MSVERPAAAVRVQRKDKVSEFLAGFGMKWAGRTEATILIRSVLL